MFALTASKPDTLYAGSVIKSSQPLPVDFTTFCVSSIPSESADIDIIVTSVQKGKLNKCFCYIDVDRNQTGNNLDKKGLFISNILITALRISVTCILILYSNLICPRICPVVYVLFSFL